MREDEDGGRQRDESRVPASLLPGKEIGVRAKTPAANIGRARFRRKLSDCARELVVDLVEHLERDDARAQLELGGLHSQTVYDAWFYLQYYDGNLREKRDHGCVRLRFSVSYLSDRQRFLATVQLRRNTDRARHLEAKAAKVARLSAASRGGGAAAVGTR